jgi:hypothetical protein
METTMNITNHSTRLRRSMALAAALVVTLSVGCGAPQPTAQAPDGVAAGSSDGSQLDAISLGRSDEQLIGATFRRGDPTTGNADAARQLSLGANIQEAGGTVFADDDGVFGMMTVLVDRGDRGAGSPGRETLLFGTVESMTTTDNRAGSTAAQVSVVQVTTVLPVRADVTQAYSWDHIGCSVDGTFDDNVIAILQESDGSSMDTTRAESWPAAQAWRFTRSGLEDIDPATVSCEL